MTSCNDEKFEITPFHLDKNLMSEINVYLKNNEAKECCFFTYNYLEHKIDENLISKGCYKFSVRKNNNPNLSYETIPFLTLTYKQTKMAN